jgi:hypothetical protein
MDFLTGLTNLTNWLGNVIMPTLAALFFAIAILRYAKGYAHGYVPYAGFACLMVSGILRGLERFTSQAAWNDPDLVWISLRGLVAWTCNVFMPVYAVLQVVQGVLTYGGVGQRLYAGGAWMRHFAAAAMCLMLSGLLRLAEFFVGQGVAGVS